MSRISCYHFFVDHFLRNNFVLSLSSVSEESFFYQSSLRSTFVLSVVSTINPLNGRPSSIRNVRKAIPVFRTPDPLSACVLSLPPPQIAESVSSIKHCAKV